MPRTHKRQKEKWRWVARQKKKWYKVSNRGRIKSVDRYITQKSWNGETYTRFFPGKILSQNCSGRKVVSLGFGNVKDVARLVLEAFVGPCPPGKEACHKDDNLENNWLTNLYWGTRRQNMRDAARNGVVRFNKVLTSKQRRKILRLFDRLEESYRTNKSCREHYGIYSSLAERFGVSRMTITRIIRGRENATQQKTPYCRFRGLLLDEHSEEGKKERQETRLVIVR